MLPVGGLLERLSPLSCGQVNQADKLDLIEVRQWRDVELEKARKTATIIFIHPNHYNN